MTSTSADQQTEQTRVTNAATIATLVSLAVRDGILRPVKAMNGGPDSVDYVSVGADDGIDREDVRIGSLTKDQYGIPARVYVDVRIAHVVGGPQETTDHRNVSDFWELSISATTTTADSRRHGDIDTGGQIIDTVAMANNAPEFLPGLVKVWRAHHLSGLHAACDHQTPMGDTIGERLDRTPACPVTGYRYGSKWLVEDLPADAVQTVIAFLRQARKIHG